MSHDIYICYDKKDEKYGDALYNIFEKITLIHGSNQNIWVKETMLTR